MRNFEEQFEKYHSLIEAELDSWVLKTPIHSKTIIYEAMSYSIGVGGKRIRPILALALCDMLGGNIEEALPFAVAIEMIHTYSLIHDDLPCMDDDDLRRGKPSCHKVFGEAIAILAGDALLTEAFEIMARYHGNAALSAEDKLKIIMSVAHAAGPGGMIGGQVLDMLNEGGGRCVTIDELRYMYFLKTGQLFSMAAEIGAIVAGAGKESTKRIGNFAENLGLAFQIKDDILDIVGNSITLGKNIGMDVERGKSTFVTVLGLDGAIEMLEQTTKAAIGEIAHFGEQAEFLAELTKYLLEREN